MSAFTSPEQCMPGKQGHLTGIDAICLSIHTQLNHTMNGINEMLLL